LTLRLRSIRQKIIVFNLIAWFSCRVKDWKGLLPVAYCRYLPSKNLVSISVSQLYIYFVAAWISLENSFHANTSKLFCQKNLVLFYWQPICCNRTSVASLKHEKKSKVHQRTLNYQWCVIRSLNSQIDHSGPQTCWVMSSRSQNLQITCWSSNLFHYVILVPKLSFESQLYNK
jgi:hypothetical protein